MHITSVVTTSAVLALLLSGLSPTASAQEPVNTAASAATQDAVAAPAPVNSKVRIVRLSEVKGEVKLDRNIGRGFETPMTNLPITEGVRLQTGEGVAEVEFEDNSTVRIGPNALVEFPRLEMLPGGAKASSLNVRQGTVYVNLMNTKGNEFTVTFGKEKLNLPPDSHIRLDMTSAEVNVAVLKGQAIVEEPSGSTPLGKNRTMTFNLANESQPVIARNVADEPLDSWDKDAVQYHKNFANATSYGNQPYSYGINDMNYYGSFVNAAGCGGGSLWRPYFTSASWDPYGSGAWAYYPSAGYSWVSPYPWGWTPYHYGSWDFCPGIGWGWHPGGVWQGLANNSFRSTPTRPHPPTRPPVLAQSTIVPVNLKAIPSSNLTANDKFVFRSDSAGLGVPRASLGKLSSFSNHTEAHGVASTHVYFDGGQRVGSEGATRAGNYAGNPAVSSVSSRPSSSASMSSASMGSHGGGGATGGGGGGGRH
jgi:hypothetical protein